MAQSYDRRINLYINIDGKQVTNNVKSIRAEMTKLVNSQRLMTIGSQEYNAATQKIKYLNGILTQHSAQVRDVQKSWSMKGMADGFNRYMGMITAFAASATGLVIGFKQIIQTFNDYEERVDNLSALTGLAGESLEWLSQKAKELSTSTLEGGIRVTQSAQEIIDAFTKTGSARPELLKNKEALVAVTQEAIILANAAKTELYPAIEALTMVMNQYNVPATEARRIINSLAAGSKEGAGEIPYLTAAFEKAGTVAADAKIPIETLVATIETLAPRITQPETAGRSLKGVLLDMQVGADDTNPAIVGLATALENLGKKNLTVTELTKKFGVENITTAKILIDNVGELKRYEAAVTGTNVALEQAAINTDNNNAKLAQAKNRLNVMSIELGEKLAPALQVSTNGLSYLIKGLTVSIDFLAKHKQAIILVSVAILAYVGRLKLLTLWESLKSIEIKKGIVLSNLQALAIRTQIALTGEATMAQKRALVANSVLNASIKGTPWGLIISLATTAGVALFQYAKKKKEAAEAGMAYNKILKEEAEMTKGYSSEIIAEKNNLNTLVRSVIAVNDNETLRKILIEKIKKEYPDFLKGIDSETISNEQLRAKLDQVNTLYSEKIRLNAQQAKLQAINNAATKAEERKLEIEDRLAEIEKERFRIGNKKADKEVKELTDEYKQLNVNLSVYERKAQEAAAASNKLTQSIQGFDTIKYYNDQLDGLSAARKVYADNLATANEKGNKAEVDHYTEQIRLTDEQITLFKTRQKELLDAARNPKKTDENGDIITPPKVDPDNSKAATEALEYAYKEQQLLLKDKFEGEETLQKEYKVRMLANDLAYIVARQALTNDDATYLDLQSQYIDKQREYTAAIKEATPEILLNRDGINERNASLLEEAKLLNLASRAQAKGAADLDAYTAKQIQQAETIKMVGDVMTDYVTAALNGSIDEFQSFGDTLILMSLQILKQMVPIWTAQILGQSLATAPGPAGIIKAAIVSGILYAAIAAAEGAVKNGINKKKEAATQGRAIGGFMQGKQNYTVSEEGTEWISPHWMLRNPVTGPMIANLEAMRTNPVTVTQAAVQASRSNRSSGGDSAATMVVNPSPNNPVAPGAASALSDTTAQKFILAIDKLTAWEPSIDVETYERKRKNWETITTGGLKSKNKSPL